MNDIAIKKFREFRQKQELEMIKSMDFDYVEKLAKTEERDLLIWQSAWEEAIKSVTSIANAPKWNGQILPADFTIECFGGNNSSWISKPNTSVRIIHLPTGLMEHSTSCRSVHANKAIAWEALEKRLIELAASINSESLLNRKEVE